MSTPATGSAHLTVDADGVMPYDIELQSISTVTASHIHLGEAGRNGPIIADLFLGPSTGTGEVNGSLVSGTVDETKIKGAGGQPPISMDSLVALMRVGGVYVNIHTTANRGGEIRGQIMPGGEGRLAP